MNTNYPLENTADTPYNSFATWRASRRQAEQDFGTDTAMQAEPPCMSCVPSIPPVSSVPGTQPMEMTGDQRHTHGFLRMQIGKLMRVEFLIGNQNTNKVGKLIEVGASYILLQSVDTYSTVMCDLNSVRFVTIVDAPLDGCVVATS